MEIDPCAKYDTPVSCKQKLWVGHEEMSKPYKFDLEVKGQRRIGIVNVCDTHEPNMVCLRLTGICTDRRTDQTDRVIPMYPPLIARRGYTNK